MSLIHYSEYTQPAIIGDKIGVEGNYVNHPDDRGGPTKFGVTLATAGLYKAYLMAHYGWDGDMRNLTQPMAIYVYIQEFWNKMSLDAIFAVSPLVADKMFDIGINMGVPKVSPWLQQILNVLNNKQAYYPDLLVDGHLGQKTCLALASLKQARPKDGIPNVLWMLSGMQTSSYINQATNNESQETFESGWQNRGRNQYGVYLLALTN